MDKFEVEKLSMKMEALDNLLLAMEVSSELNKMTEGAFANGRAKN